MEQQKNFWLQYLINILYVIDLLVNTLLFGHPKETISVRAGLACKSVDPYWLALQLCHTVDWIFLKLFKEKNHTKNAIESPDSIVRELISWIRGKKN